ncbi:MAG: methyltransferase domain-containing protein [Acidobacteria bacterium]|nr:methyltransferase domain-containing protein [Acidobacteriota bacterium]
MSPDRWDPRQYERFLEERGQPFLELMALVEPQPDMRVVDLGCGTGRLTRQLQQHLKPREILGLDLSPAMLAESSGYASGALHFELGDIAGFSADHSYDLVFSNSALHWIPDHPALFARLTAALVPGGQLAVQMPAMHQHPSHWVAAEVAADPEFASALGGYVHREHVLSVADYESLLVRLGYARHHARLQIYRHELPSREEVVEWVKGTLLVPYQERLQPDMYERFLARYREKLLPRLEDAMPYVYEYRRILLWGRL